MVTLRGYRLDDEDTVVTLWWDSWHSILPGLRHPQPFVAWCERWASDIAFKQEIVVADDEGAIVGFAAADMSGRELTQIFVDPSRKGEGIGGERHELIPGGTRINSVNGMQTIEYRWVSSSERG